MNVYFLLQVWNYIAILIMFIYIYLYITNFISRSILIYTIYTKHVDRNVHILRMCKYIRIAFFHH